MKIVVGLGNLGGQYDATRHNVGFWVVDRLVEQYADLPAWDQRYRSLWMRCRLNQEPVGVMKPKTFMNASGDAVLAAMTGLKIKPDSFLIVYDDFDLPLGSCRYRQSGSGGSHNGMRSIVAKVGPMVPRLRIGIGPKPSEWTTTGFVLGAFSQPEQAILDGLWDEVHQKITDWLSQ